MQQAIGEATRAGTHVKADSALHIHAEVIKRTFELEAAPADKLRRGLYADLRVFRNELARFGDGRVIHQHVTSENEPLALLARVAETTGDEQVIEPLFHVRTREEDPE